MHYRYLHYLIFGAKINTSPTLEFPHLQIPDLKIRVYVQVYVQVRDCTRALQFINRYNHLYQA